MKHKNSLYGASLCISLLAMATGCTHLAVISVRPTSLPADNKLTLRAVLELSKDLADYKHEYKIGGDTWVFPYGPPLQDYARQAVSASFKQVFEASTSEEALANSSADIVLIPRPVKADQSLGVMAWSKVNFTLVIEWRALDRASKNTIWLKTITADASETEGNLFTGKKHRRILIQKLFDDLSFKTHEAFQNAPELRSRQP